jgi:hypothetical protein
MYTSTEISGSAARIVVVQLLKSFKKLLKNYQEDMILTGQVYLLMRYHKGIKPFGYFLSVWFCVFGFSSTIRKFYSALIRNSIITSGYICAFLLLKLTGLENNICSGRHGNVDRIVR